MPLLITSRSLRLLSARLHPHQRHLLPLNGTLFRIRRALLNPLWPNPNAAPTSRCFSTSAIRRKNTLMETSGFTETQLMVRESVGGICGEFGEVSCLWLGGEGGGLEFGSSDSV